MSRNDKNSEILKSKASHACPGNEPYIYLNFSRYEMEDGLSVLDALNSIGCRVRYDENMQSGRFWTGDICDAIEGCTVFFEVIPPEYHFSPTKILASEFAGLLQKKKIFAHLCTPESHDTYSTPAFFYSPLNAPSFPDLCHKALDHTGYFTAGQERATIGRYDLMLDYYQTAEDMDRAFGGLLPQSLNLRTHESHGYLGHSLRNDEDVFAAVRYGRKERYYISERSAAEDYKPDRRDKQFTEKIPDLNGKGQDPERKTVSGAKDPKPGRPFPPDHPYKDEFEYLSSDE